MKKPAFYFLLIIFLSGCSTTDTDRIIALEDQWMEALVKKDTVVISEILDQAFILNGSSSINETRSQYLETSAMAERNLEPLILNNREYSVHDNTVISTGSTEFKGAWKGNEFSVPVRYTFVWMKKNGDWKAISAHLSELD